MAMRFRIIKNIFKQGLEGLWRNRTMGLASVSSILAVLLILGLVLILVLSINNAVVEIKSQFDVLQVFLEDEISPKEMEVFEDYLRNNDKVDSFQVETSDEALEKMKESLGEDAYILDGMEKDNRLPNSFIIKLKKIEYTDSVVGEIKELSGVDTVPYYKDLIDKLIKISTYIRMGGLIITGALVFVSIFIISNTIKLTVASRKREINIMKYVGATNGYIRGPFIMEGILFGLVAAALAILFTNLGYEYFFKAISDKLYYVLSIYLIPPEVLFKDISIIFISIGAGIGAVGSILSLKRYLNV